MPPGGGVHSIGVTAAVPAYLYTPARPPAQVREGLVQDLLDQVFHGSAAALVQTLVRGETLSAEESAEIQKMLARMAGEEEDDG